MHDAINVGSLEYNEIDAAFENKSSQTKPDPADLPIDMTIIKENECRMRESPKSFNFFLLCLG